MIYVAATPCDVSSRKRSYVRLNRAVGGAPRLVERPVHDIRDPSRYDVHQQQVRSVTHPAVTGGRRAQSERSIVVVEVRAG